MRNQFASSLTLVFLATLLAGCGFHLRGMGDSATILPDDWKSMSLYTSSPNSEFTRELISRFEANGVVWTTQKDANYRLRVTGPDFDQRNLTLNSAARVAEFELTMSALFIVFNTDGSVALEENKASVVKHIENDPRNVVGTAEQIKLLQQEMRTELARQIARRIGFFASSLSNAESAATGAPNNPAADTSDIAEGAN